MIKLVFGQQSGWLILLTACSVSTACPTLASAAEKFLSPVQCDLGKECFVQQYPILIRVPWRGIHFVGAPPTMGTMG